MGVFLLKNTLLIKNTPPPIPGRFLIGGILKSNTLDNTIFERFRRRRREKIVFFSTKTLIC